MKVPLLYKLAALMIVVPLLDLGSILLMSHYTGGWITFGTVVACGLLGAFLVRREGVRTWNSMREEIAMGRLPERPLLDAVLVLISGVLLMTPGPLTDTIGLVLLIPPVRDAVRLLVRQRVQKSLVDGTMRVVSGQRIMTSQRDVTTQRGTATIER